MSRSQGLIEGVGQVSSVVGEGSEAGGVTCDEACPTLLEAGLVVQGIKELSRGGTGCSDGPGKVSRSRA